VNRLKPVPHLGALRLPGGVELDAGGEGFLGADLGGGEGGVEAGAGEGVGFGEAFGEEDGEGADEGVASAGSVERVDGKRWNEVRAFASGEEAAAFAEREDDVLEAFFEEEGGAFLRVFG